MIHKTLRRKLIHLVNQTPLKTSGELILMFKYKVGIHALNDYSWTTMHMFIS
jgi:hypothetical protein